MLRTPSPFPQVGSYALIELEGHIQLARIVSRTAGGDALVSLPLLADVASGNRTVHFDKLIDGTPLSEAERRELDRLQAELPKGWAMARPTSKSRRVEALRDRLINAERMAGLMKRLPNPERRASRVAA